MPSPYELAHHFHNHPEDVTSPADELVNTVETRSRQWVEDNIKNPNAMDYVVAMNLMMLGASIANEIHFRTI